MQRLTSHTGALVAAAVIALSAPEHASADVVREVVIAENTKTTDATVRYIAGVDEGDPWTLARQEEVRLELISSGLFKEVDIFSEPHPKGGTKVTIIAKDKHSWVVAPTYYNQPTNKGGGVGFGENNLFGKNKKLLLYGQVATGDSFFVGGFRDPSFLGAPIKYQIDVFLRRERVKEYQPENDFFISDDNLRGNPVVLRESKIKYLQGGLTLGVTLFRSILLESRTRAAHVSYTSPILGSATATESMIDPSLVDGCLAAGNCVLPKPGAEGWDVSTSTSLRYNSIANYYGVSTGNRYQISYERALPVFGSDFDYWKLQLNALLARRFFSTHNLIFRSTAALGRSLPFHAEMTTGGTALRGYKNRQFRGDLVARGNLEYSFQLFNIKGFAVRPLIFADTAYTGFFNTGDNEADNVRHYLPGFDDHGDGGLSGFRNAVGIGTRLYIRQIVLPLLGLDVGYGLESGGFEIYFAIGLTDT